MEVSGQLHAAANSLPPSRAGLDRVVIKEKPYCPINSHRTIHLKTDIPQFMCFLYTAHRFQRFNKRNIIFDKGNAIRKCDKIIAL
jgi:hypothetical protein